MHRFWILTALLTTLTLPAGARDLLVMSSEDRPPAVVKDFKRLGFDTAFYGNPNQIDVRRGLVLLANGLTPQDQPVVIYLRGSFAHGGGDTRFMPSDRSTGLTLLDGLSLASVFALLDTVSGKALLVLGDDRTVDAPLPRALSRGFGRLNPPAGVAVVSGTARDVDQFVNRHLAVPGRPVLNAARQMGLQVHGSIPRDWVLLEGASREEQQAWDRAVSSNKRIAYRLFLNKFPNGIYAAEARARLAGKTPQQDPPYVTAEKALGLTRDERRTIQRQLTLLGHSTRGIDGIFGKGTRAAIKAWQRQHGVRETGYMNETSIASLAVQAERRAAANAAAAERRRRALVAEDRAYWNDTGGGQSEAGLRRYLERYPDGVFADRAEERLAAFQQQRRNQSQARDRNAWEQAATRNTVASYRAYLDAYPNGAFADEASARINAAASQGQRQQRRDAARAAEEALNIPQPLLLLVEARLQSLGLDPGAVDGTLDKRTRRALRQFQEAYGLEVTGFLDEQTVSQLVSG